MNKPTIKGKNNFQFKKIPLNQKFHKRSQFIYRNNANEGKHTHSGPHHFTAYIQSLVLTLIVIIYTIPLSISKHSGNNQFVLKYHQLKIQTLLIQG